jgi:anthranilate synthase component I
MTTSFEQFQEYAEKGKLVPIRRDFLADLETPITALLKLKAQGKDCFLLESAEKSEESERFLSLNSRYTFVGHAPFLQFESRGNQITLKGERQDSLEGNALEILKGLYQDYPGISIPDLPPFVGGSVGYIAYDAVRYVEAIPNEGKDELNLPDIAFGFYDTFIVFDNVTHKLSLIANARLDKYTTEDGYQDALQRLDQLESILASAVPQTELSLTPGNPTERRSNFTRERYHQAVEACKEYITAGDAFQVVLSQRFSIEPGCSAIDIYRSLRTINPSDYMFYLKFGETEVVGASPELLAKKDSSGKITTRPIAGTRPRGATVAEDIALEKELLADEKELAEHLMLVDLGRNDIGRVSKFGSVNPTEFMGIKRYSHIMHIVSTVEGELKEDMDALDTLFACFPAGTLSGAPKIRAMEIIDELEGLKRGIYGGAICYRDFCGNLNSCIAIRTMVMENGISHIQAGAGIVADSDPESEYMETIHKCQALFKAIEEVKNLRSFS